MLVRFHRWLRGPRAVLFALGCVLALANAAHAQLRVVSYNTAGGPRADMDIILRSIGEEELNGIARPIDVLLLQEQNSFSTTTQSILDILNAPTMYGAGAYSMAMVDGDTTGSGRPGLIYKTSTVQLIGSTALGTASTTGQPRQTLRYQLRPFGLDSSADFYAYNSHYKSDTGSTNEQRRLDEAMVIRANSDALGQAAHIIYAGDHNVYTSSEPAFQTLIATGAGQAFDPINRLGSWTFNSSFDDVHTQAPCLSSCGGLTTGGMDDRFDFQLLTGEFFDGEGMGYIPGSYRAFGNAGGTFNNNINAGCDTMGGCLNDYVFGGVTSHSKKDILDALHTVSDHLPVVVDYELSGSDPPPPPQVIARWTFETGTPGNPPSGSGSTIAGISPVQGAGTASGSHVSASTTWSNPAGNGSDESFSSNNWAIGDYYQFETGSEGLENLTFTFDQVSSGTGPRDFQLSYSTDGSMFTNFDSVYMVRENSFPAWASGTATGLDTYSFDLSSVSLLDDQTTVFFRLSVASGTSANNGTIGGGGTSRLDNVTIMGTLIPGLGGDFNADGIVDAADYVMWRKTNSGDVSAYVTWVTHFGETSSGVGGSTSVPEPAFSLGLAVGVCLLAARRGKLAGWSRQQ
jgi:hypothetical protein